MTEDEWWQCQQEYDIATQVRQHSEETGRDVREILQSMKDEGYVECSDEAFERVIKLAGVPAAHQ